MDQTETKLSVKEDAKVDHLDNAVKNLLTFCNELLDIRSSGSKSQPFWSICANKFQTTYLAVNNSKGYIDVFQTFHAMYWKQYCVKIFDDDDQVNDSFFKDKKEHKTPGSEKKTNSKTSWKTKQKLKGPVIYFSITNEKMSSVCIPIGEIYTNCLLEYNDMVKNEEDDMNIKTLPSKFLYYFYNVIFYSYDENKNFVGKAIIKENIDNLKEVIDSYTVESNEDNSSNPFSMIKGFISTLASGSNPIIPGGKENATKVLDGLTNTGNVETIKNAFSSIVNDITSTGSDGKEKTLEDVIGSIAKGLTDQKTIATISSIKDQITMLTGTSENTAPPAPVDNNGAEDQE